MICFLEKVVNSQEGLLNSCIHVDWIKFKLSIYKIEYV